MAEGGAPDLETQKNDIAQLVKLPPKKGDAWFLLNIHWYKQWKKYVGFDPWDTINTGNEAYHPGPIDNSNLLKDSAGESGISPQLKEHLVDELDYVLVPAEAWNKLVTWYSLQAGQEPIERRVIEQGMFVKHCKVEVYPMDLMLSQNSDMNTVIIKQFSRMATIKELEQEMRRVFSIEDEEEVRLWNRYMSNTYEHLSKMDNTLQDTGLYQGQVIVVERRNIDGTWPRSSKSWFNEQNVQQLCKAEQQRHKAEQQAHKSEQQHHKSAVVGVGGVGLHSGTSLACAVCLGIYRDPKFLPCYHTFCASCVQDWAGHHSGGTFPCPSCRKMTSLPAGGVAALQGNFYIGADDLERARKGNQCPVHSQKELEFFCVPCDKAICINCKLTDHESHKTQDLNKTLELRKKELPGERSRVQKALAELAQQVEGVRRELQLLQDQKAAVEATIHARHTMLIATANKARDKELTSLQTLNTELEGGLAADLAHLQKNLDEVRKLDQQLKQAINSGADLALLTLAKEMKDGKGNRQSIQLLTSVQRRATGHLELKLDNSSDAVLTQMLHFIGSVRKVQKD